MQQADYSDNADIPYCRGDDVMRSGCSPIKTMPAPPAVAYAGASGRGSLFLLAALLVTMSAGCTGWREYFDNGFKVGPNYCRPAAPVADQWIDAGDSALDNGLIHDGAWWQTFQGPRSRFSGGFGIPAESDLARRRTADFGGPCPAGHGGGRVVPAIAVRLRRLHPHANEQERLQRQILHLSSASGDWEPAWPGNSISGVASGGPSRRRMRIWTLRSRTTTACWCCS